MLILNEVNTILILFSLQYYLPSFANFFLLTLLIFYKLHNDKEIVILRQDKGSGVVVLNRRYYEKSIKNVINDKTKFNELSEDVTIKR